MHTVIAALVVAFMQTAPAPGASALPASSPAPVGSTAPSAVPMQPPAGTQQNATTTVQPNFGDLIASLNNMRGEIAKIQAMNGMSVNNVQPVNVAQINGSNPGAINGAIARNQSQLTRLRAALSRLTVTTDGNQRITVAQFLADNKMSTSQIIGADVRNGKLLLYYQK
jgi:hypothetical protein